MTKDELITKQQLQIEFLKQREIEFTKSANDITMSIVCIGAPLNDNILGYTHKQLKIFFDIKNELEEFTNYE